MALSTEVQDVVDRVTAHRAVAGDETNDPVLDELILLAALAESADEAAAPPAPESEPTGLPIEVADETERLGLTPVNEMRVLQANDGMAWAYIGGGWLPAPALDFELSSNNVLSGQVYRSLDNPFTTYGTFIPLTVPGYITPEQKFCDYISLFVGAAAPNINDSDVTYISASYLVSANAFAQMKVNNSFSITLNCALSTSNVDDILSELVALGISLSGTLNLLGLNGAPTPSSATELPGATDNFGGVYQVVGQEDGKNKYSGASTEPPYYNIEIKWNTASNNWSIYNVDLSSQLYYSQGSEINPWDVMTWFGGIGPASFVATQASATNAALQILLNQGVSVSTN